MSEQKPGVAESLRALAAFIDRHPECERFPALFEVSGIPDHFSRHRFGPDAAQLDELAEAFGIELVHRMHGPEAQEPGARYSSAEAIVDGVTLRFQTKTEDYEAATGKTVQESTAACEARLAVEAKHVADNPVPDDSAVTS